MPHQDSPGLGTAELARKTAMYFALFAFIALAMISAIYVWQARQAITDAAREERLFTGLASEPIAEDLGPMLVDLHIISRYSTLRRYLDQPGRGNRESLQQDFTDIANAKGIYDQIRLLDLSGREDVRVDFRNGAAVVIPDAQLQDKSDRYYFSGAIGLDQGQIYISPLDLNVERGAVEIPHKPMIRAVTPVFDSAGHKRGVLVLNYLAAHLLAHMADHLVSLNGRVSLLNAKGYWLRSPDVAADDWAFMFPDRLDRSFAHDYPEEWRAISAGRNGQFRTAHGIFTYVRISPAELAGSASRCPAGQDSPDLIVVSRIGQAEMRVLTRQLKTLSVATGGIVLILLLPVSLLLARYRQRRDQAVAGLRERERLYRALAENFPNGAVFLFDTDLRCLLAEGRGLATLGVDAAALRAQGLAAIFPEESREVIREHFQTALAGGDTDFEMRIGANTYHLHLVPVAGGNGEIFAEMLMTQDITERKRMEEKLTELATVDALTGLLNRRQTNVALDRALAFSRRYKTPLTLCMADIDKFKSVNDTYGHAAGDQVISGLGAVIRACVRETDQAGRFGGDEFIIAMPNTPASEAVAVVERIRKALGGMVFRDESGREFTVTGSFGLSELRAGQDVDALVAAADSALYSVKRTGRDQVCVDTCPLPGPMS